VPLLVLLALFLVLLVGACSNPEPRKISFMANAEGARGPTDVPVGLNPLGSLDTCLPASGPRPGNHVLISRPETFTHDASLMISALRDALSGQREGQPSAAFLLAPARITSAEQARTLGQRCGSLLVLWEPGQARTLELTLPEPTRVPLRELVQTQLCEFGDHSEQLRILYLTIAGLLSLRENDYEKAVFYMNTARTLDNHCLHLPGAAQGSPAKSH
jgi:hypothetical protein